MTIKNKLSNLIRVIIFIFILIICFIILYVEYNKSRNVYIGDYDKDLEYMMKDIYEFKPDFFKFDENGIAIVTIDELLIPITNGEETMHAIGIITLNENQDECVGYIIVQKLDNNDLKVDTSHVCDMIDY